MMKISSQTTDRTWKLWYDRKGMDYTLLWGCGCSGGGSPSAYIFAKPRLTI